MKWKQGTSFRKSLRVELSTTKRYITDLPEGNIRANKLNTVLQPRRQYLIDNTEDYLTEDRAFLSTNLFDATEFYTCHTCDNRYYNLPFDGTGANNRWANFTVYMGRDLARARVKYGIGGQIPSLLRFLDARFPPQIEFGPPSAIVSKANFIQHTTDYLPDYPASWVAIIMYIKAKLIVLPKHAVLHQR